MRSSFIFQARLLTVGFTKVGLQQWPLCDSNTVDLL